MGTEEGASTKHTPKRRAARRLLPRGEPVVRGVLSATLEMLAQGGYSALRIEDVAARAKVNKTTVYRRWPTKEDLVRAAFTAIAIEKLAPPDTGSLEGDLLEVGRSMAAFASSTVGQSVGRVVILEGPDSELMKIVRSLRETHELVPRSLVERAVARGEITPKGALLLFDALKATVHHRMVIGQRGIDDRFIRDLVKLLLYGAVRTKR